MKYMQPPNNKTIHYLTDAEAEAKLEQGWTRLFGKKLDSYMYRLRRAQR
jgi:hypothetical protein